MNASKPTIYILVAALWTVAGIAMAETFTGFYAARKEGRLPPMLAGAARKTARMPRILASLGQATKARRERKASRASRKPNLGLISPSRRSRVGTDTEDFFPLRTSLRPSRVTSIAKKLLGREDLGSIGSFRIRVKFSALP